MPSRAREPYFFTWKQVTRSSRRLENMNKGSKPAKQAKVINRHNIDDEIAKAEALIRKLQEEHDNKL